MAEGLPVPEAVSKAPIKERVKDFVGRVIGRKRANPQILTPESASIDPEQEVPREAPLPPEKSASEYKTNFLRENEINTVWDVLQNNPAVMVLGEEGRGKSPFLREITEHASSNNIPTTLINIHQIEEATEHGIPGDAQAVVRPYTEWLDKLPVVPIAQRPLLVIDAADWLYLARPRLQSPIIGTEKWNQWQALRQDSQKWKDFVYQKDKEYIDKYYQRDIEKRAQWDAQHPDSPWKHPIETIDQRVSRSVLKYEKEMEESQVKADFTDSLGKSLQEGKVRLVLTDHNYDRSKVVASEEMMRRYDGAFGQAAKYELPGQYEINRARLFIENSFGITDAQIQDKIIEATKARNNYLKNAFSAEDKAKIKTSTPDERKAVIKEAVSKFEPKRLYRSLSAA